MVENQLRTLYAIEVKVPEELSKYYRNQYYSRGGLTTELDKAAKYPLVATEECRGVAATLSKIFTLADVSIVKCTERVTFDLVKEEK